MITSFILLIKTVIQTAEDVNGVNIVAHRLLSNKMQSKSFLINA